MLITNATLKAKRFRFSRDFLAQYYKEGDPFQSLLARSTYLNKYCRDNETWTDTICRVVEANLSMAASINEQEAKVLFHLFWTGQALPPGRGLWTGGVEGIPADARYNCWYTTLYGIDDWCWTANQLMLGGGVGVGLGEIDTLPVVQREPQARFSVLCSEIHPDVNDVNPNAKSYLNGQTPIYKVPDSREGWVEALRTVLTSAFYAKDLIVDVSEVRARGMPIRTFGGIACGPGPLTNLLRNSWLIVRGAAGRRLNSVEALDITNYIGLCIKAGNVRRSALIAIGDAYDQAFRDAKKDMDKVVSHRHTSNNTIAFRSWEQLDNFDWDSLVRDMSENGSGEPGILNLPLVWKTDAGAKGVNPCGEVPLHDREACNLAEVFPAKFEAATDPDLVFKLITRYCLRQRLSPLLDERADSVQKQNMRVGVGLGGLCDFDWTQPQLSRWYQLCREEASSYSRELGVADPIAVTTVKPSGTISLLNGSSPGIHAPSTAV